MKLKETATATQQLAFRCARRVNNETPCWTEPLQGDSYGIINMYLWGFKRNRYRL